MGYTDAMQYWVFKSEPGAYSIEDLRRDKATFWDGVRNYQARNFLRDGVRVGDQILFYHSNARPPGVAGIAEVSKDGSPDPTQFDTQDPHYDAHSKKDKPRWYGVTITFKERFPEVVSLAQLRTEKKLRRMTLLQPGQRLSVMPITRDEFVYVCTLAHT